MEITRIFKKIMFQIFKKKDFGQLGDKSFIDSPLKLSGCRNIHIGNAVSIYKGARIEVVEKHIDTTFSPNLTIGDNTSFEQDAHIICASKILIGHDCTISARVFITNVDHSYNTINQKVLLQKYEVKDVEIGNYCFLGMDVKIFPGVHLGDNVIIGANSIVMSDIPAYCVAVGTPAKVIKRYDFDLKQWIPDKY